MLDQFKARRAATRRRRETVLLALLTYRPGMGGYDLMQHLGWWSGTLYPILARLEAAGQIRSWWADGPYPRRRLYGAGQQWTAEQNLLAGAVDNARRAVLHGGVPG